MMRPSRIQNFAFMGIFVALLLLGRDVRAERLRLVVGGADFRAFPVAVPGVQLQGDKGRSVFRIKNNVDTLLKRSINFVRVLSLVPPKSYVSSKREIWTRPVFANWLNVGASGLVRGQVRVNKKEVSLGLRFYDVIAQKEMLYRQYTVDAEGIRQSIYHFVDELVETLTGDKGIFSSKIAFVKKTKKGKAIYISDIGGSQVQRLTNPDTLSLLPTWDQRGQHVMFTSYLKGNPDLYRINISNKKLDWLSKKRGVNSNASVSPDQKRIALTLSVGGDTDIYLIDWQGDNLKRLTSSWGQDISATWSPDGKRIAFVSSRSGQPHIYIMNADGSNQRRLTFQGTYNQEPDWSPRLDGQIVFTARDEKLKYDIFLVHPDTGAITRLTQDEGHRNDSPSFSPDGQHVLFASDRPPHTRMKKLFVMDVDGRNQRRISAPGGHYEDPDWGPRIPY
jgi:TolB protein